MKLEVRATSMNCRNRCVAVARLSVRVKSKSAVDVKGIAKVPKGLRLDAEEMRSG